MECNNIENELGLKINKLMYNLFPFYLHSDKTSGIYYLINKTYTIIYIGQSKNIEKRIRSHCCNIRKKEHWMSEVEFTAYKLCNEELLLKIEKDEILKYKPIHNIVWCKEKVTTKIIKPNVDLVRRERLAGTTWRQLEEDLKVSTTVMIRRLKAAGHWDFTRRTVK